MKLGRSVHWGAIAALAMGLLALLVAAERLSQRTSGDPGAHNERLLTSVNHGNHNILNSVCKRLLGGAKCEKLSHTRSHVWIVARCRLGWLEQRLPLLGIRFAVVREDWNYILRRNKAPMSTQQGEQLARARESTGMVAVGAMRAPEAAVAEYALTETPEQGNSTIIVRSEERRVGKARRSRW